MLPFSTHATSYQHDGLTPPSSLTTYQQRHISSIIAQHCASCTSRTSPRIRVSLIFRKNFMVGRNDASVFRSWRPLSDQNIYHYIAIDRQKQPSISACKCQRDKWFYFYQMSQQRSCVCFSDIFIGQRFFPHHIARARQRERQRRSTLPKIDSFARMNVHCLFSWWHQAEVLPRIHVSVHCEDWAKNFIEDEKKNPSWLKWKDTVRALHRRGKRRSDPPGPLAYGGERYRRVHVLDSCFTLFHFLLSDEKRARENSSVDLDILEARRNCASRFFSTHYFAVCPSSVQKRSQYASKTGAERSLAEHRARRRLFSLRKTDQSLQEREIAEVFFTCGRQRL